MKFAHIDFHASSNSLISDTVHFSDYAVVRVLSVRRLGRSRDGELDGIQRRRTGASEASTLITDGKANRLDPPRNTQYRKSETVVTRYRAPSGTTLRDGPGNLTNPRRPE